MRPRSLCVEGSDGELACWRYIGALRWSREGIEAEAKDQSDRSCARRSVSWLGEDDGRLCVDSRLSSYFMCEDLLCCVRWFDGREKCGGLER